MMTMEDESQYRNNLSVDDIDLSLLHLNSPPYDSSFSPEISPLKRSSPVSDESDHPKRRKLSPHNPILIHPENQSSSIDDPTHHQTRSSHASPVSKTETIMMNHHVEETNYCYERQQHEEEEDCGEGMRIERSGAGFIIRLKCRCRLAFRVLFSDHHLYFKPL